MVAAALDTVEPEGGRDVNTRKQGCERSLRLVGGIVAGFATGNPTEALLGAQSFLSWVYEVWQEAANNRSEAQRPTRTVSMVFDSITEEPAPQASSLSLNSTPSVEVGWSTPSTREDEPAVTQRQAEIAALPQSGTDFDNWLRAVIERQIAKRAE